MKCHGLRYILAALIGAITMHIFNMLFGDFEIISSSEYYYRMESFGPPGSLNSKINFLEYFNHLEHEKEKAQQQTKTTENNNDSPSTSSITLLPSKLYTIVGLESSGTTFVSHIIGKALKLDHSFNPGGHEGIAVGMTPAEVLVHSRDDKEEYYFTEVQHVSLPWGLWCTEEPFAWRDNIVPVIYPWLCMRIYRTAPNKRRDRDHELWSRCQAELMQNHTTTTSNEKKKKYGEKQKIKWFPDRHFLNISSHYDWYKQQGVDIHLIIVIRDTFISRAARADHCPDPVLAEKEEHTGTSIINEAIQRYIITKKPKDSSTFNQTRHHHHHGGILASPDNKVVVVSYEMLNRFQDDYLQLMYTRLGINSTYQPEWKDGNAKYVQKGGVSGHRGRDKPPFRHHRNYKLVGDGEVGGGFGGQQAIPSPWQAQEEDRRPKKPLPPLPNNGRPMRLGGLDRAPIIGGHQDKKHNLNVDMYTKEKLQKDIELRKIGNMQQEKNKLYTREQFEMDMQYKLKAKALQENKPKIYTREQFAIDMQKHKAKQQVQLKQD